MGNQASAQPERTKTKRKKNKKNASPTRSNQTKYEQQEIGMLDQMFHEMAVRSPDDTIAKDTFLKFFDLPGVLGDRLFEVFDTKKTGVIDFEEFMDGYQRFARGDPQMKMDMLFQLFDLDGKGGITKLELRTVLMSIVVPPNQVMHEPGNTTTLDVANSRILNKSNSMLGSTAPIFLNPQKKSTHLLTRISDTAVSPPNTKLGNNNSGNNINMSANLTPIASDGPSTPGFHSQTESILGLDQHTDDIAIDIEDVQNRVELIVQQAFQSCDVDDSGRLDATEFREWLKMNTEVVAAMDELFVQLAWNGPMMPMAPNGFDMEAADAGSRRFENIGGYQQQFLQCNNDRLRFVATRESIPTKKPSEAKEQYEYIVLQSATPDSIVEWVFCPACGQTLVQPANTSQVALSMSDMRSGSNSNMSQVANSHEGVLKMDVGKFRQLKARYIRLHGKFLYIYKNEKKKFPDTIVFIQGYFAELTSNPKFPNVSYLRLNPPPGSSGKAVHLYCDDSVQARTWLDKLEISAQTINITKYYKLGQRLGKGSFAEVREATEKSSGRKVAVKIIEKKVIDGKQKEYIRIEMSVMKLVRHPNVMRLEQVFETKSKIYMVMPMFTGGDLYDYMKHNARHGLKEDESRWVIWYVLNALKYLHSVGIVHRDLKPENLLLKKKGEPTDIVITDFGLSKFAAPHEAMKAACGTLSYVAPEVLRMEGYGKEVDLWSTGVIMFLTLRAKLPFHDQTKNKIIARILRQGVQMIDPHWQKVSKEAKDLITKLLTKHPQQRVTCEQAMKHAWFEPIREQLAMEAEAKEQERQLVMIADVDEDGNEIIDPNTNGVQALYPEAGGSVKNIRPYEEDESDSPQASAPAGNDDEEEEDSEDDEDGMPRMALLKQNSVVDIRATDHY